MVVSITDTLPWKRFDTHSWLPSADTWSMSGLPPTGHVARTWRVARSITVMLPSRRLLTYSDAASRLTLSPWAPVPVRRKPISVIDTGSTIDTPCRPWLVT